MLLDLFLIGLVVTLEPIPITAMILLLATEGGLLKGLGYVIGWMVTLVAIVALTILVTGGKPLIPNSNPSTGALALKLAIGVVLVVIAYRRWGRWESAQPKNQPKWMTGLDRVNPLTAAGLGFSAAALGPGHGGRGRHHHGQDLVDRRIHRRVRLLPPVLGDPAHHGDLRRVATGQGAGRARRPACSGSPRTGTRSLCSCRSAWASTSWRRASTGSSAGSSRSGRMDRRRLGCGRCGIHPAPGVGR